MPANPLPLLFSPRRLVKTLLHQARRARVRVLAAPRSSPRLRHRLGLPANVCFDPLADALTRGVRIFALDPAEEFHRPLPDLPGANPAARAFFAARTRECTGPRYVAEFVDGLAWGHPTGGVFTADGRFAPAFSHEPRGADLHAVWTRWRLPRPRRLPGRTLYLVTPEATDNYHHWLIDLLPRLGLVRRAGYALDAFDHVIVNHRHRRYQFATLARLGIPPEKILGASPSLHVRADLLVVPSLKPGNQSLPAADAAFLRAAFLDGAAPAPRRRIFLSRRDAAFRRLRDEAAFHPLLRAHDLEIVSMAGLDLPAQARLFAEAAVIVGPAGAAFANLVFATAPAGVVELAPPQWLTAFHWMISARLGLRHAILLGEGPVMRGPPDGASRRCDITFSAPRLAARLAPLLGGAPAGAAGSTARSP